MCIYFIDLSDNCSETLHPKGIPANMDEILLFPCYLKPHTNKITLEHFCPQHRSVIQRSSDYETLIKHDQKRLVADSRSTSTFLQDYNVIILVCLVWFELIQKIA